MAGTWNVRAEGVNMIADAAEMRRAVELFADPEAGFELMALRSGAHKTFPGGAVDEICRAANELPSGSGIYFRFNPVPADLRRAATDSRILRRRWIYIDVDPKKPESDTDNPSTDIEQGAAGELCDSVIGFLNERGWPAPVVVDSGNGYGIFYRCDLPNDELPKSMLRAFLNVLSDKFTGDKGTIDKPVFNACRLAKLPGTWARKGVASEERPHRQCRLLYVPEIIEIVTYDLLATLVGEKMEPVEVAKPRLNLTPSSNGVHKSNSGAWGRAGMDRECARVACSRPPALGGDGRNNTLFRAAAALGNLIGGGELERGEVERRLYEAACSAGLDTDDGGERGILATMQRGIDTGAQTPRTAPESNDPRAIFGKLKTNPSIPPTPEQESPLPLLYYADILPVLDASDFVEDLLTEGTMSVIYGESGCGKTFFMLDLALHVASGLAWRGREVERGGVLYLALEGSHGIRNRIAAFKLAYGAAEADLPLAVVPVALNLLDPAADTGRVIEAAKIAAAKLGLPVKLVVVDTLSRAMAGGNENDPADMTGFIGNIDRIRQEIAAHVAVVHHSGKDVARGARGHSSLRAATDTEIEVSRGMESSISVAKVKKQRDLDGEGEFPFRLESVTLGTNRRGKPVTSCIVRAEQPEQEPVAAVALSKDDAKRVNVRQKLAAAKAQVLRAIDDETTRSPAATKTKIKELTGYESAKVNEILNALIEDGEIERATFTKAVGNNADQVFTGFRRPQFGDSGTPGGTPGD